GGGPGGFGGGFGQPAAPIVQGNGTIIQGPDIIPVDDPRPSGNVAAGLNAPSGGSGSGLSGASKPVAAATSPDQADSGVASKTITLTQALSDLTTALADSATTTEQLKQKLEIVRDARLKTRSDMENARKELLKILTTEQEATLVSLGYIE
ncbi:MAG TPA: hypothetical protein VHM90_18515, partial [Phycisphaerae bacterium]|nr:hypothetical protein [Phycisphaerae bacterium]